LKRKAFTMQPDIFDLFFVLTAVAFNLLVAALFVASKRKNSSLVRGCETAWLLLAIPPRDLPSGSRICLFNEPSGVTLAMIQAAKR
jgi:hypothetical protein